MSFIEIVFNVWEKRRGTAYIIYNLCIVICIHIHNAFTTISSEKTCDLAVLPLFSNLIHFYPHLFLWGGQYPPYHLHQSIAN